MGTKIRDFVLAGGRRRLGLPAVLAGLLLAAPPGLMAERYGATLRIEMQDGSQLQGELLTVKGETLILQARTGSEARADIRDVARVRIMRPNRVGKGLAAGMLTGFALGCLVVLPFTLSRSNEYSVLPLLIYGGMFGGAGGALGAGAGLISSSSETIQCQGRNDAWRSIALKRFQRLARFRDEESPAAGSSAMPDDSAVLPSWPQKEEFKHWRLGITLVRSPRAYGRAAANLVRGFRYEGPITPGAVTSSRMSDDDGRGSWVGLSEVRCAYSFDRRWAIGFQFNPFAPSEYVYGIRQISFYGQEADVDWNMNIESQNYFCVASYSFIAADGFVRRDALRFNAGLGWNRSSFRFGEYGYSVGSYDDHDPSDFNYSARSDTRTSSSLCALAAVEAAHYFNGRWSLALDAGFRYIPLRVPEQRLNATIGRYEPVSSQSSGLTIPRSSMNIGGIYLGVSLGFHF